VVLEMPSLRDVLLEFGFSFIHHATPLQYVPLILSTQCLRSKKRLIENRVSENHFRRSSARRDCAQGFGDYVHFMSVPSFPLLADKLKKSFAHVRFAFPVSSAPRDGLLLCRYNIAKHRLSRGAFQESAQNG
jgi:hypothetical protein